MRKILYSPGYGTGWSTAMDLPPKFCCQYEPIIEALERGENLLGTLTKREYCNQYKGWKTKLHPAVRQFLEDAERKYGKDNVCLFGLEDLKIEYVNDDCCVRIKEHDGDESVEIDYTGWF